MTHSFRHLLAHSIVLAAFVFVWGWALPALAQHSAQLENPLRFQNIAEFIEGLLRAIVMIALPVISFFIVLAGFYFVWAQGNPGKLEKARNNFLWVIIGSALILGAWVLATLIGNTVTQLVRGS